MSILVSIAIPFYNDEKYLEYAILSVINQTFQNWELLLMNDGGKDGSLNIATKYSKLDPRIKLFSDGVNKGLVARLNQSILLAKGKYYARMDADDIMYKDRIRTQVEFLESNENVDIVGSSIMVIDDKNNIKGSGFSKGFSTGFVHPTIMGKIVWFRENKYNAKYVRAEDTELWFRTSKHSVFYNIDKPLFFYREFGVPTLNKYIASMRTMKLIFRNYEEYGKTFKWAVINYMISDIKILVYVLFSVLNKTEILISHRRKKVPVELCLNSDHLKDSIRPIIGI